MKNQINYTGILNKIFTTLVVIAVLLFGTLVLQIISIGSWGTTEEEPSSTSTSYDVSMFKEVDAAGYAELFSKDELAVTYFGRSDCGYCIQFLPSLQKSIKEYNLTTYYVDINKLDQDTANVIFALDEQFADTLGRTPMMTITKNGKIVDIQMGAVEYETYINFLKTNNVIK